MPSKRECSVNSCIERTVHDGVPVYRTPPGGGFPRSIARQPRGCQYRMLSIRLPKALSRRDASNADVRVPTQFQLWKPIMEIGPGAFDIHHPIRLRGFQNKKQIENNRRKTSQQRPHQAPRAARVWGSRGVSKPQST